MPDSQFFSLLFLSLPHHTLYTQLSNDLKFHEWVLKIKQLFWSKKNYLTTTDGLELDIFLLYTCIRYMWSPRKKRITKNCCVFFCFPIQHTHFIQHSTFVRSIPKSFVEKFFFARLVTFFSKFIFAKVWKAAQGFRWLIEIVVKREKDLNWINWMKFRSICTD